MNGLAATLRATAESVAQAGVRVHGNRVAGTAPDVVDRQVLHSWLTVATTLAVFSCECSDPYLKAEGARLHQLTETFSKTMGVSLP